MTFGSPEHLRYWRFFRQGLDSSLHGQTEAAILEQTGWARSVGGAAPYLTLWARGRNSPDSVNAALAANEICELPSARGCTYVVPLSDFALALRAAQAFTGSEMAVARKLGATDAEIDKLCTRVLDALSAGPLDPEGIRGAVGDAVRSFGPEGKKKGLTTTLPIALERLQVEGEIRRVPVTGRLDSQRYRYLRWSPGPLGGKQLSPEEVNVELARKYFRWIGPASIAEFQWFSGLGVKAAKAAVAELGLTSVDAAGLMFADDLETLHSLKVPKHPQYALVSSLDGISLLRRDVSGLLSPEDVDHPVVVDKGGAKPLGGLADLPSHAILDRGRLIGLWEFDPGSNAIVWSTFRKADSTLGAAVAETEAAVCRTLGDVRSFSLDSPVSRAPRIEALRAAAAGAKGK